MRERDSRETTTSSTAARFMNSSQVKQTLSKLDKADGDARRAALNSLKQCVDAMDPASVPRFITQVKSPLQSESQGCNFVGTNPQESLGNCGHFRSVPFVFGQLCLIDRAGAPRRTCHEMVESSEFVDNFEFGKASATRKMGRFRVILGGFPITVDVGP